MNYRNPQEGSDEARLDSLFETYRAACPDQEPGADFMPQLWQKIEARERVSTVFGRLARNLTTAALALSVLLGLAVTIAGSRTGQLPTENYVEVLAEDRYNPNLDYFEPVRISPAADRQ
jgi:hypothetical protein